MPAQLIIQPEAERDIDLGYAWYESRSSGQGGRFVNAVEACFQAICRSPKGGRVLWGPYRRAIVVRYPYIVAYAYDEPADTVTVHCVFHTSQDPSKLQQRLP